MKTKNKKYNLQVTILGTLALLTAVGFGEKLLADGGAVSGEPGSDGNLEMRVAAAEDRDRPDESELEDVRRVLLDILRDKGDTDEVRFKTFGVLDEFGASPEELRSVLTGIFLDPEEAKGFRWEVFSHMLEKTPHALEDLAEEPEAVESLVEIMHHKLPWSMISGMGEDAQRAALPLFANALLQLEERETLFALALARAIKNVGVETLEQGQIETVEEVLDYGAERNWESGPYRRQAD